MKVVEILYRVAAVICVIIGLLMCGLSGTLGVGIVGVGAIAGIFARLFQADWHHIETMKALGEQTKELGELRAETELVKRILAAVHNVELD